MPDIYTGGSFSGNTPVDVVFFPAEMTVIIACMCCSAVHLQGCCDTVAQFVFFECEESPFGISGIVGQDIDKARRDDSSAHVDHIMARDRRLAHYQSASRSYADVAATPSSVDIGLSSSIIGLFHVLNIGEIRKGDVPV